MVVLDFSVVLKSVLNEQLWGICVDFFYLHVGLIFSMFCHEQMILSYQFSVFLKEIEALGKFVTYLNSYNSLNYKFATMSCPTHLIKTMNPKSLRRS